MRGITFSIGLSVLVALLSFASPRPAAGQEPLVVPAATEIVVRLIDPLDSSRAGLGEVTRASVEYPIVLGDTVAIRKDSDAIVDLVRSEDKHYFVKLSSVTVNGKAHPVSAGFAEVKAAGKGGKTARRAVGLGAIGAIVGGIAGGGKGAAIGAGAGAGLGAVSGQLSGTKIQLPSETLLSFQLRAPLTLD